MTTLVSTLASYVAGSPGQAQGPTASGGFLSQTTAGGATEGIFGTGGQINLDQLMAAGTTAASAASVYFGNKQQADYLKEKGAAEAQGLVLQSQQSMLDAKQAELQGQQKANSILDTLVQTLATQRLNFSGNGMDPTFGTPVSTAKATSRIANLQLSTTRSDAQQMALSRRAQSASYRAQAAAATSSAAAGANELLTKGSADAQKVFNDYNQRRLDRG